MMAHAPGPWHRGELDESIYIWDAGEDILIGKALLDEVSITAGEGNANLMAAAPELLEACENALVFVTNAITAGIEDDDLLRHVAKNHITLKLLRSAIAKAKR